MCLSTSRRHLHCGTPQAALEQCRRRWPQRVEREGLTLGVSGEIRSAIERQGYYIRIRAERGVVRTAQAMRFVTTRSSGTSPNFLITVASVNSPVEGSPLRLNASAPTCPGFRESGCGPHHGGVQAETFQRLPGATPASAAMKGRSPRSYRTHCEQRWIARLRLTTLIKAQTGKYLLGLNLTALSRDGHATTGVLIVNYAFGPCFV